MTNPENPALQKVKHRQELRAKAAKFCSDCPDGLDPLYAAGLYEARGDYVVIRAITEHDYQRVSGIEVTRDRPSVRSALLFEIMGIGSTVPEANLTEADVGKYCTSLATSLNPVNGMKASLFAMVHYDTIASVLDAESIARMAGDLASATAERRLKANGLVDSRGVRV